MEQELPRAKTRLRFGLHNRLHHFLHEEKLGESGKQESRKVQQQKEIATLTAQLKEQAAQIQKVSAQLEMSKPAAKVVVNKP